MRFVIDETSWNFSGLAAEDCLSKLEHLLDNIESEMSRKQEVCYSEDLFHTPVLGDQLFYELYDPQSPIPIPREIQERIATLFARLQRWQDFQDWPASFDVSVGGTAKAESAPSIAWAHNRNRENVLQNVACLVFSNGRQSGLFDVYVSGDSRPVWFISEGVEILAFFRWLILRGTNNPHQMEALSASAFPALDFVPGAFNGIKDMSKGYADLLPALVHHLSVLSDHGTTIFTGPHIDAPGKFGALGLNVSDENGGTKSNGPAKKDHTRVFLGKEVQFWWHSKIERDRDRIHVDPTPVNRGGKITVGIFCRHLLV